MLFIKLFTLHKNGKVLIIVVMSNVLECCNLHLVNKRICEAVVNIHNQEERIPSNYIKYKIDSNLTS